MYRVRLVALPIGLVVIGVMAALAAFKTPERSISMPLKSVLLADAVNTDFDTNNGRAEGAPQQQVVAGWATKDMLYVLVDQGDRTGELIADVAKSETDEADRLAKLVGLAVLAICWAGIWLSVPRPVAAAPTTAAVTPPPPPSAPGVRVSAAESSQAPAPL